uniref:Uncharacterized protein n=1 Tax=Panagrolaimus sp. ES5 TaxID=591445 RepID=A0AC34GXM6_9BILA
MFLKNVLSIVFYICYANYIAAADNKKCPPLNLAADDGNPIPKLGAETKVKDVIQMPINLRWNRKKRSLYFNGNIGGPSHPKNEPIIAHLHCIDGKWKFTENDISIVVTEVSCISV